MLLTGKAVLLDENSCILCTTFLRPHILRTGETAGTTDFAGIFRNASGSYTVYAAYE